MITYTYIVKCPECEDEFFDFFDEAKEFALSCLTKKPIITQTEVQRNDFGECTDHCDLGTVWSWEDMMCKETDAEPAISVFTKDDLKCMADGKDPEFDNIDNSVDYEEPKTSEVSDKDKLSEWMTVPSASSREALWDRLIALIDANPTIEEAVADEIAPLGGYPDGGYVGTWDDDSFPEDVLSTEALKDFVDKAIAKYSINESAEKPITKTWICWYDNMDLGTVEAVDRDEAFAKFEQEYGSCCVFDKWEHDWDVEEVVEEACAKKPIPEGMTIEQLQEEMEDNEDTVECSKCGNLVEKANCHHNQEGFGWCCNTCEPADILVVEPKEVHDLGNTYDGGYPEDEFDLDFPEV